MTPSASSISTFVEVYQGKDLPLATQILITIVETAQANVLPALTILVVIAIVLRVWYRTAAGRSVWDRVLLGVPWIGDLLMTQHTIRFTRTLATVLGGGTPVVEALQICRGAVSNRFLANGVSKAVVQIREGATVSASLAKFKILPRLAMEMIAVGEETGSLETMLRDVADFFESEMDFRLSQLTTWIETGLLLFMGFIVGAIVVVMYLPIFQMAGAV